MKINKSVNIVLLDYYASKSYIKIAFVLLTLRYINNILNAYITNIYMYNRLFKLVIYL